MRTALFSILGLAAVVGGAMLFSSQSSPSQIAAVTAIGGSNTTATTVAATIARCTALTRALSIGSTDAATGGEVTKLQTFLAADKELYPEGKVTGYFGPATARAVKRWQAAHNITQTGGVGPLTRASFVCKTSPPVTTTPAPSAPTTPSSLPPTTSTTAAPTCVLSTDKENYSFSDHIIISWTSTAAKYVTFVQDTSGAAQLSVLGTYAAQGSITVTANVSGTLTIPMYAYGDGGSTLCKKTIVVSR